MDHKITSREDYRHPLNAGEHEAFHFLFTAQDGDVFGYARLLFGHADVLEVLALRADAQTWVHQQRRPRSPLAAEIARDIAGEQLAFRCVEPWQHWQARYAGSVTAVETGAQQPLELAWDFHALTPPTRYPFGPTYQQVEQEGAFQVTLRLGDRRWEAAWTGGRDHSWGRRPMGAVRNCAVITIPHRLYTVIVDTELEPPCFGHWRDAAGQSRPVVSPQLTATDGGWTLEDAPAGSGVWTIRRLADPLLVYYGAAGEEDVRSEPRPGDLLRDEISPARFISPTGDQFTGFLDLLWEVNYD